DKHCHCSKYRYKDEIRPVEIEVRRRVGKHEVDVIVTCYVGDRNVKRTIGFELKENDIYKAVEQAILRRQYFTWFYIVMDLSVEAILAYLRNKPINAALKHGIGFVSGKDNCVVIQSYAKQHLSYAEAYTTIFNFLGG
ncbi:MAG: hypothetical protein DRN04_19785, partial [Thermoprotei archaeon]